MTTETLHHVTKTSKHNPTFFKLQYILFGHLISGQNTLSSNTSHTFVALFTVRHMFTLIHTFYLFRTVSHPIMMRNIYIYICTSFSHLCMVVYACCMCITVYRDIQMFVQCPLDDMFVYSGHFQRGNTTLRQIKLSVNE